MTTTNVRCRKPNFWSPQLSYNTLVGRKARKETTKKWILRDVTRPALSHSGTSQQPCSRVWRPWVYMNWRYKSINGPPMRTQDAFSREELLGTVVMMIHWQTVRLRRKTDRSVCSPEISRLQTTMSPPWLWCDKQGDGLRYRTAETMIEEVRTVRRTSTWSCRAVAGFAGQFSWVKRTDLYDCNCGIYVKETQVGFWKVVRAG
jgi:hypothetical protein